MRHTSMDFTIAKNNSTINLVILSLFLVAIIPLSIWSPIVSRPIFSFTKQFNTVKPGSKFTKQFTDELEEALSKASTRDKTLIITVVNNAYVEPHHDQYPTMFDLFLEGFWVGERTHPLLDRLLVVAMDQTAYDRCKFGRLNCYRLAADGVDFTEEKLYMTEDFIKMMWARTLFLLDVLKRGYNFIFTDTDVLWLRNPFSRLKMLNETDDLQISTDTFKGNPRSTRNLINTGFYHIRSNNKTIALFQTWYDKRQNSTGLKEQDVLGSLIHEGIIHKLGLSVRFLDTLYFSGFCENSRDVRLVSTVHANCCRSIGAKIADLTGVLKDWKRFKKSRDDHAAGNDKTNATNAAFQWSRHDACGDSWRESPQSLY